MSKAVNAGFTSMSSIKMSNSSSDQSWIKINPAIHPAIDQGLIVMKNSQNEASAFQFEKFLFSKKAREIFKDFGYLINESP